MRLIKFEKATRYTDSKKHITFGQMWNFLNYEPEPDTPIKDVLADVAKINHHVHVCEKCKGVYNSLNLIINAGHVFCDMSDIIEEFNNGQLDKTQTKFYLTDKLKYFKTCVAPD